MSYVISKSTKINDTSPSSSITTGAFIVKGGIATEENIHSGGYIGITGSTNTVNIKVQSATNSFNFNLPTSAGSPGQILTSSGGLSKPMTWSNTNGTGSIVLSSGPIFGVGGITSVAGPTILGETTIGMLKGTSATFSSNVNISGPVRLDSSLIVNGTITLGNSTVGHITGSSANFNKTLNVTGLSTFLGGIRSISGNTILGSSTIGPITGTSATFSSSVTANGISRFPGGLVAGTTRLGISTIADIIGTSASFSTTLNVSGLSTFSGGLTSTSGTTTLGKSIIGDITGTSARLNETLTVSGFSTFLGGISSTNRNTLGETTIAAITGTSAVFNSRVGSSSTTTGALRVRGGISTQENLHIGGCIGLHGSTSGIICIKTSDVSGTYNFNLPTSAGSPGQVLTSQGGSSNSMSWTTLKKIQSGMTGSSGSGSVLFKEAFPATPVVVVSGPHSSDIFNISVSDVSPTGFSYVIRSQNINGGLWETVVSAPPSHWIAMFG